MDQWHIRHCQWHYKQQKSVRWLIWKAEQIHNYTHSCAHGMVWALTDVQLKSQINAHTYWRESAIATQISYPFSSYRQFFSNLQHACIPTVNKSINCRYAVACGCKAIVTVCVYVITGWRAALKTAWCWQHCDEPGNIAGGCALPGTTGAAARHQAKVQKRVRCR